MPKPRILVLRGGAIGDFIFTLPALQALRTRWPDSYIEIIGYPHIAQLAQAGRLADAIASLDKAEIARYFSFNPSIPDEQVDYIKSFDLIISYLFDPAGTVKENLRSIGAKQVIYGCPIVENAHAVDVLMKPLEELAIYSEGIEYPCLRLKDSHKKAGSVIVEKMGKKIIAIHPGSGSPKKNWPLENFLSLGELISTRTNIQPVFILGEADNVIAEKLASTKTSFPIVSGHSLVDLAGILSACAGYIGNDSGITHLAASLGITVVAIYGPTDPAIWAPRGPNVKIVTPQTKDEKCLTTITPLMVFNEINF
ncbi:MAG: glycosyltransferase family 9 protein [Kiritimatiellae bacterium]|nr:glycosyltransferase family 9 protein [Kiritimatiellia bacterium]MDD5520782.1 glycosyltransferase family 9 protein [Kiritimatiellia bacterium]